MSDARADRRNRWARPRSGHDRWVKVARVALPSGVGALVAVLAMAPLADRKEVSFVLAKDKVERAAERLRVGAARYGGQDGKGRPFSISAGSAVQATSQTQVVRIDGLSADIGLADGPAKLAAPTAGYDMSTQRLQIDGPLAFESADGYRLSTSNVGVDLTKQTLDSRGRVEGSTRLGRFSAGSLSADLDARTVTLSGGARLHIVQGAARGRR